MLLLKKTREWSLLAKEECLSDWAQAMAPYDTRDLRWVRDRCQIYHKFQTPLYVYLLAKIINIFTS